jgi:hypothetical protein
MRLDLENVVIAQLTDGSTRYLGPMCIMADFMYNDADGDLRYIFLEQWNHECDTCGIYKIMVLHNENENEIFVSDPMRKNPTLRTLNKNEIKYKEVAFDIRNLCPIDYKDIQSMQIFHESEQYAEIQDRLKSLQKSALLVNQKFQTLQKNKNIAPKKFPLHASEISKQPVKYEPEQPKGLGDSIKKITEKFGIKQCNGCQERQTWLNKVFSYNKKNK